MVSSLDVFPGFLTGQVRREPLRDRCLTKSFAAPLLASKIFPQHNWRENLEFNAANFLKYDEQ
jgi:hypothetical protein